MKNTPILDHIALTVPNLDELVERLMGAFGIILVTRAGPFAVLADPASGLKLELGQSGDNGIHFRHLGFRADDIDSAHESLTEAGMQVSVLPHRRDFARLYTSFLKQTDGFEVQLVKYD